MDIPVELRFLIVDEPILDKGDPEVHFYAHFKVYVRKNSRFKRIFATVACKIGSRFLQNNLSPCK
jgi:predicted aminopeptidase